MTKMIRVFFRKSVDAFVKDLKRTLRKDMSKRMCETLAFLLFDNWWKDQEDFYRAKVRKSLNYSKIIFKFQCIYHVSSN